MVRGSRQIVCLGCMFFCMLAAPSFGQDDVIKEAPGVELREGGAVRRYSEDFFTSSNAITARDLIRAIPGTANLLSENADSVRGFGSTGDQILINGKRISGKSNDISDELDRIQAAQIAYVDVIRGTVVGLDVRSEGLIVDVVLKEDAGGSGSWQAHLWMDGDGTWKADGQVSYADKVGNVNYQATVVLAPYNRANNFKRDDLFVDPAGIPFEAHRDRRFDRSDELSFAGKASMPVRKTGIANLNLLVAEKGLTSPRTIQRADIEADGSLTPVDVVDNLLDRDEFQFEIGADISLPLRKGTLVGRLIYSRVDKDRLQTFAVTPVGGESMDLSRETTDELDQEFILRGSYIWALNPMHSLDVGAEIALNSLDKTVLIEVNEGEGLMPIEVGTPDSKVTEKRGEIFATHFWTLSSKAALESAINLEFSEISQAGTTVDTSRSFFYPKPRIELRYDWTAADQLRASISRTVSQLDFNDFVAQFDDDDDRIDAGNPDLVPEKAWVFDITYERRFPRDLGLISFRGFYEAISDHIDRIEIGDGFEGTGNIGSAHKLGFELTTSLRLDRIGLKGAVIDATYTWQDTQATDSFTGLERKIRDEPKHLIEGTFRHDINSIGLSYWVEFLWRSERVESGIDFLGAYTQTARFRLYIQQKLFDGVSLWFNWRSLNEVTRRERQFFEPDIADGDFAFTEQRRQQWDNEFIIGLRGVF